MLLQSITGTEKQNISNTFLLRHKKRKYLKYINIENVYSLR